MNDTFNFERDFPELYTKVQKAEARTKRVRRLTFLISVAIGIGIGGFWTMGDVSEFIRLPIVFWVTFSSVFAVRAILERYIK